MSMTPRILSRWLLVLMGWAGLAVPAFGCTACFGQSDSEMAQGMNWGIYTLLGVIGMVLAGIATAFVAVGRRSSRITANPPSLSDL